MLTGGSDSGNADAAAVQAQRADEPLSELVATM